MSIKQTIPYSPEYGSPLEHAIVRALVKELRAAGWRPVWVCDGEEDVKINASTEHSALRQVLDAVFAVDDSSIQFQKHGRRMSVMLIGGNGVDLISDYHCAHDDKDSLGAEFAEVCDRVSDACDVTSAKSGAVMTLHIPAKA